MAPQPLPINRPPRYRNPPASTSDPKAFVPSKPSPLSGKAASETGSAGTSSKPEAKSKQIEREGKGVSVSPLKSTLVDQGVRTHVDSRSPEPVPRKVIPAMRAYDQAKMEHARRTAAGGESPASLRRPDSPDSAISSKSTEPRQGKMEKPDTLSEEQRRPYQTGLNTSRSDLRGEIRAKRLPPRMLEPESFHGHTAAEAHERLPQLKRGRDHARLMLTRAEERVGTAEARVREYQAKVDRSGSTSSKIKQAFGVKKSAAELAQSLENFKRERTAAINDRDKVLQDFTKVDGRYQALRRDLFGGA